MCALVWRPQGRCGTTMLGAITTVHVSPLSATQYTTHQITIKLAIQSSWLRFDSTKDYNIFASLRKHTRYVFKGVLDTSILLKYALCIIFGMIPKGIPVDMCLEGVS